MAESVFFTTSHRNSVTKQDHEPASQNSSQEFRKCQIHKQAYKNKHRFTSRPKKNKPRTLFLLPSDLGLHIPIWFCLLNKASLVCWKHSHYNVCTGWKLFICTCPGCLPCVSPPFSCTVRTNRVRRGTPIRLVVGLSYLLRNADKQTNPETKLKVTEISHVFFRTPCSICQWYCPWRDVPNSQLGPNEFRRSPATVKK